MFLLHWQIKLYYYDTVIERYMETKLEVHRSKTLAEATEIAWKVLVQFIVRLIKCVCVPFDVLFALLLWLI